MAQRQQDVAIIHKVTGRYGAMLGVDAQDVLVVRRQGFSMGSL